MADGQQGRLKTSMGFAAGEPNSAAPKRMTQLDGLRGIAALCVFFHHILVVRHGNGGVFEQASMAVDFFFLLSGFVIGEAYERKLEAGLTTLSYMKLRLARLYPMIALGAFIGFGVGLFREFEFDLTTALVAQLLFVPFVVGVEAYPLNGVQWSLAFELIANAVHAALRRWLTTRVLAAIVAVSAALLCLVEWYFGNLGGGVLPGDFWVGFIRVAFSFSLGLLIFRRNKQNRIPRISLPYWVVAGALFTALALPHFAWAPQSLIVIVVFPLILIAALPCKLNPFEAAMSKWGGDISYPLYAIHAPLLHGAALVIASMPSAPLRAISWAGTIVAIVAIAWVLEKLYDAPVRKVLTKAANPRVQPA